VLLCRPVPIDRVSLITQKETWQEPITEEGRTSEKDKRETTWKVSTL